MSDTNEIKNTDTVFTQNDVRRLLAKLDDFGSGNFDAADAAQFDNSQLADAYNSMLDKAMDRNTKFLARINDATSRIVDNHNLRALFEQIEQQQSALNSFSSVKSSFERSNDSLEAMNYESLALSRQARNALKPSIRDMSGLKDSIQKIIDELNQLHDISDNTDVTDTIILNTIFGRINAAAKNLQQHLNSLDNIIFNISSLIDLTATIANNSDRFFSLIDEQLTDAKTVFNSMASVSDSYSRLSGSCFDIGSQLYRISRDIDNARNDLYRYNSIPTIHDAIEVFKVDHLTLAWRLYTHVIEYETLRLGQVNNSSTCKFGIWCKEKASDPIVGVSDAFKKAVNIHERFHFHSVACFEAKEASDIETAIRNVNKALSDIDEFHSALDELHDYLKANGYTKETELWVFNG